MGKDGIKKDRSNIAAIVSILLIILAVLGVIKCDSDKMEKHLQNCREKCKPEEVVELLSKRKCVCKEIINEENNQEHSQESY